MSKLIGTLVLLLALVVQTFSRDIIYLTYYTDRADYEMACVNKNRPQMHCCGQCLLKKRLAADSERQKNTVTVLGKLDVFYVAADFWTPGIFPYPELAALIDFCVPDVLGNVKNIAGAHFHPPAASLLFC